MNKMIVLFVFILIVIMANDSIASHNNDLSLLIGAIAYEQKSVAYKELLQPTKDNLKKCEIPNNAVPKKVLNQSFHWVQQIVNKPWLIDGLMQNTACFKDLLKWELPYPGGGISRQIGDYIYYTYTINNIVIRIEENGICVSISIHFQSQANINNPSVFVMQWATNVLNIPSDEISNLTCQVNQRETLFYGTIRKTKNLHPELKLLPGVPLVWYSEDFKDIKELATRLSAGKTPLDTYVWQKLSPETRELAVQYDKQSRVAVRTRTSLVRELNFLIAGPCLYQSERFDARSLTNGVDVLIGSNLQGEDMVRLNRLLLEAAYPKLIVPRRDNDGRIHDFKWWWHEIVFITDGSFIFFNVRERDGSPIGRYRKAGLPNRF